MPSSSQKKSFAESSGAMQVDQVRRAIREVSEQTSDFDLNPGVTSAAVAKPRMAGVLIALQHGQGGLQVILTKRASGLKHHPGQIAFPGGSVDPQDTDVQAAALREAWEEIGLATENTEVVGMMPNHLTVTGFNVVPVIAMVRAAFTPKPERGEVAEIFTVPLSHVTDPDRFQVQSRIWNGQQRYYYVVPYGPYYIWGATARILRSLAAGMRA